MNSLSVRGTLGANSAKAIPHRAWFPTARSDICGQGLDANSEECDYAGDRTRQDRNDLFGGQTQTLLPRSWPRLAFADPLSLVARPGLKPLPLEAPRPLRGCQQSQF